MNQTISVNAKAILVQPGKGSTYLVLGDLYTFLAVGEDTGWTYSLYEIVMQPLKMPQRVNQINHDIIQIGLLDVNNFSASRQYFWRLLQRFETISYIGFGNEQENLSVLND